MMEIDLDLLGDTGERAITVTAMFNHEHARRRNSGRFIVDTGSPVTILSESFRQELQIRSKTLSYSNPFAGIGGGTVRAAKLQDAEFMFKTDNGIDRIRHDVFVSDDHQDNLLGLDFFEENNIDLRCDASQIDTLTATMGKLNP